MWYVRRLYNLRKLLQGKWWETSQSDHSFECPVVHYFWTDMPVNIPCLASFYQLLKPSIYAYETYCSSNIEKRSACIMKCYFWPGEYVSKSCLTICCLLRSTITARCEFLCGCNAMQKSLACCQPDVDLLNTLKQLLPADIHPPGHSIIIKRVNIENSMSTLFKWYENLLPYKYRKESSLGVIDWLWLVLACMQLIAHATFCRNMFHMSLRPHQSSTTRSSNKLRTSLVLHLHDDRARAGLRHGPILLWPIQPRSFMGSRYNQSKNLWLVTVSIFCS